MSSKKEKFSIFEPKIQDVEQLHCLIVKSTGTKISIENLCRDMFETPGEQEVKLEEKEYIQLDQKQIASNAPFVKVFVAESEGKLIGYILFYYYYSPWVGRCFFIDDLFVDPTYELKGKEALVERVIQQCKVEQLGQNLLFRNNEKYNLHDIFPEQDIFEYRGDNTDWSVLRIRF